MVKDFNYSTSDAVQVKSSLVKDAMSQSLMDQGFSGSITLDYFDVDTDPTEKFESGYPYRLLDVDRYRHSAGFQAVFLKSSVVSLLCTPRNLFSNLLTF